MLGQPEARLRPIVSMGRVPARNTTLGGCGGGRSLSDGGGGGRWRKKVGRRAPAPAWVAPPQTSVALVPLPPAQALAALALPPPRRSAALLGFFTAHGGVAPSHLQPRRPRPTARCCVSTAGDAACPSGCALPPPAGGLPLQAALTPPAAACPGGRCWLPLVVGQRRPGGAATGQRRGDSGTKEGRQLGFGRSHRFIYVVLNGPVGLLGRRASPWAASCRLTSCRAGPALWAENEARPSPTSCSCRPGPEKIVLGSCSCRDKKLCYGLAHGPRAKWPSIPMISPLQGI
jgi:hypothetical protein